jgi:hypothetical protein
MKISKHGYYTYDNSKPFYTRETALDDMLVTQSYDSKLKFHFYDDIFDKIDWSIEPDIDIGTLYKMRAQQLRDKYDYLILSFSGGSDSTQILNTFLKNNIFIDEIQIQHYEKSVDKLGEDFVANDTELLEFLEYRYAALPMLEKVRQVSPKTKITSIDTSDYAFNDATTKNFESLGIKDKIHQGTHRLYVGVPRMTQFYLTYYNQNIKETPKRTGFIRGYEKPILGIDFKNNKELFFTFTDFLMRDVTRKVKGQISDEYEIENFFWSGDAPLIPVKQSHMIKKVLESNETFYNTFCFRQLDYINHFKLNKKGYPKSFTTERIYSKIIYPDWNEGVFVAPKPTSINPDSKLIEILAGNKTFTNDVINELKQHYHNKFKLINDKKQFEQLIFTKRYSIGKVIAQWLN